MTATMTTKSKRRRSDSSSDALRNGEPSILNTLLNGARVAPPGALYVLGVCLAISLVAILARY